MEILQRVIELAQRHNQVSPEFIRAKDVRPGLRNPDGSGVVAGFTTKGRVFGYEKTKLADGSTQVTPVPGRLYYCGYDAIAMAKHIQAEERFGFEQVAWLLLAGDQPSTKELRQFEAMLGSRRDLDRAERNQLMQESNNSNQMYALHSVVSHLGRLDPNPDDTSMQNLMRQCTGLIAKMPTIVAHNYKFSQYSRGQGLQLVCPDSNLSTAENFLYMLRGELPSQQEAQIFDLSLMLHAENGGGNNSTFSVRTVSSTGANTYMAICAGIASLSGPMHGSANNAAMRMMDDIRTHVHDSLDRGAIRRYLQEIMDRKAFDGQGKLYGIGHAVYTISDPRTDLLKEQALTLALEKGREDDYHFYALVAEEGQKLVQDRSGKPAAVNIDFFSGLVHDMLGIPMDLYTPIFAMARVAGWAAHRIEQIQQNKLIRPGYVNTMEAERNYSGLQP